MNLFKSKSKRARLEAEGSSSHRVDRDPQHSPPPFDTPQKATGSSSGATMRWVLNPTQTRTFITLKKRIVLATKFIEQFTLDRTDLLNEVGTLLIRGRLEDFMDKHAIVHPRLT